MNRLNGVFGVYKPRGWTSRKAVNLVQNKLSAELLGKNVADLKRADKIKIGHGGTLDPMAEGVLLLGVGDGCKKLSKFLTGPKAYYLMAKFGVATDTYDAEGQVTEVGKTDHLTDDLIRSTIPLFTGEISQVPPIYSALRMQGKRLYDYAREGIPLPEPIKPRKVKIYNIDFVVFKNNNCVLEVQCGGGTYMRSLIHDMAAHMGTVAHLTELRRTRQGVFRIEDSPSIEIPASELLESARWQIKKYDMWT